MGFTVLCAAWGLAVLAGALSGVHDFAWDRDSPVRLRCGTYFGGEKRQRWIGVLVLLTFLPAASAEHYGQVTPLILGGLTIFLLALRRQWFVLCRSAAGPVRGETAPAVPGAAGDSAVVGSESQVGDGPRERDRYALGWRQQSASIAFNPQRAELLPRQHRACSIGQSMWNWSEAICAWSLEGNMSCGCSFRALRRGPGVVRGLLDAVSAGVDVGGAATTAAAGLDRQRSLLLEARLYPWLAGGDRAGDPGGAGAGVKADRGVPVLPCGATHYSDSEGYGPRVCVEPVVDCAVLVHQSGLRPSPGRGRTAMNCRHRLLDGRLLWKAEVGFAVRFSARVEGHQTAGR